MARINNIFYRVVNSENSMTELLCNYMAYKPFRELFLSTFLDRDEIGNFQYVDFQTQVTIKLNNCRPDIVISNEDYEILIEVNTSNSGLTENQPHTYLQHLYESTKKRKHLIFLIPFAYSYEDIWVSEISKFMKRFPDVKVNYQVIYWNDMISAIEESELCKISEKVTDFLNLLKIWFEVKKVSFDPMEVSSMLNPEFPKTMKKLFEIVDEVKYYCQREEKYKVKLDKNSEEYTIYFIDEKKNYLLFLSVWYDFWIEYGNPLCYGIYIWDCEDEIVSKFRKKHNDLIEKEDNYVRAVPENIYNSENCTEEIAKLIISELDELTI